MVEESVAKYARTVMNCMERAPATFGDGLAVELQYLMALEFLAIAEHFDHKKAREAYFSALRRRYKTSKLPAVSHGASLEEVVSILREARNEIDPACWIDMTDVVDED